MFVYTNSVFVFVCFCVVGVFFGRRFYHNNNTLFFFFEIIISKYIL